MKMVLHTKNHNNLLYFTSLGRVFQLPVYEIPEASRTAKGQAIVNFLSLQPEETVTAILDSTKESGKWLFLLHQRRSGEKTEKEAFQNVRKSGLIALWYS